jgi:hypothetical protein
MKLLTFLSALFLLIVLSACHQEIIVEKPPINEFEILIGNHNGTCIRTVRDLRQPTTTVKRDTAPNARLSINQASETSLKINLDECSAFTGGFTLLKDVQLSKPDSVVYSFSFKLSNGNAEQTLIFVKSKKEIISTSRQLVSGDNETSFQSRIQLK